MRPANTRVLRVINLRVMDAAALEFGNSRARGLAHFVKLAELDRLGGTRRRARGLQSFLLTVVAERAFKGAAVLFVFLHHAKRTRHNAITASIAHVGLNINATELRADDCARGTCFHASRIGAVLAYVR